MIGANNRDSHKSQVYAAEDLSAELTVLVEPQPIEQLQGVVDDLCASPWWVRHFDSRPIRVHTNRSAQRSYFNPTQRCISLSPVAHDLNTLLHELAHAACADLGRTGPVHGPEFRAVHVLIRTAVTGQQSGDDLRKVYEQFGLGAGQLSDLDEPSQAPILGGAPYLAERIVGRPGFASKATAHKGPIAL